MNPVPLSPATAWHDFRHCPTEDTFRPFYEVTKDLVWTLCLRILRDSDEAGDAFRSTYCRLLTMVRDPGSLSDTDDPRALLCRLATREGDRLRKRRVRLRARENPAVEAEAMRASDIPAEEAAAREEIRELVETIVDGLPERFRLPVQLHYLHGLSMRDVARALGEPPSTIADRIQVARAKLVPAFRRSGLGDVACLLGAIGLTSGLLAPAPSASVVFREASARAAAVGAADLHKGAAAPTPARDATVAVAKGRTLLLTTVAVLLAGGWLLHRVTVDEAEGPQLARHDSARAIPAGSRTDPPPDQAQTKPNLDTAATARHEIEVVILWDDTGKPVEGASVFPSAGASTGTSGKEVTTGQDGRARFEVHGACRSVRLEVSHPWARAEAKDLSLPHEEPVAFRLTLDVITCVVVDAVTGDPIADAALRSGDHRAVTDKDGTYGLAGVGAGVHILEASAEGYADHPARVSHEVPGESIQDFRLDPAVTVVVTVVDRDGNPLTGAAVTPSEFRSDGIFHGDRTRRTNDDGEASFSRVSRLDPPTFSAEAEGYKSGHAKPAVDLEADLVELAIALGRIRVRDRLGSPGGGRRQAGDTPGAGRAELHAGASVLAEGPGGRRRGGSP